MYDLAGTEGQNRVIMLGYRDGVARVIRPGWVPEDTKGYSEGWLRLYRLGWMRGECHALKVLGDLTRAKRDHERLESLFCDVCLVSELADGEPLEGCDNACRDA